MFPKSQMPHNIIIDSLLWFSEICSFYNFCIFSRWQRCTAGFSYIEDLDLSACQNKDAYLSHLALSKPGEVRSTLCRRNTSDSHINRSKNEEPLQRNTTHTEHFIGTRKHYMSIILKPASDPAEIEYDSLVMKV